MEFQGTVEIDRLLAERPGLHGIEYLVRWKNYNHYGDTWEPHEHIYPPSKLTTFYSRPTIQVSLTIPVWLLRDSIARQCSQRKISERGPVFRRTVPVDGLIVPEVGKAVIDHIRHLFSPPLPLVTEGNDRKVIIEDLVQVSEAIGLHVLPLADGSFGCTAGSEPIYEVTTQLLEDSTPLAALAGLRLLRPDFLAAISRGAQLPADAFIFDLDHNCVTQVSEAFSRSTQPAKCRMCKL